MSGIEIARIINIGEKLNNWRQRQLDLMNNPTEGVLKWNGIHLGGIDLGPGSPLVEFWGCWGRTYMIVHRLNLENPTTVMEIV